MVWPSRAIWLKGEQSAEHQNGKAVSKGYRPEQIIVWKKQNDTARSHPVAGPSGFDRLCDPIGILGGDAVYRDFRFGAPRRGGDHSPVGGGA